MIISDLHLGRFGRGREENANALTAFATMAAERGARFWVNGDLDEDYLLRKGAVDLRAYRADAEVVRRAFEIFCRATSNPIDVLRGNHDHPQMDDALLQERIAPWSDSLRFRVHRALAVQPEQNLVLTHGHIIDGIVESRMRIQRAIKEGWKSQAALDILSDPLLEELFRKKDLRADRLIHLCMTFARRLGFAETIEDTIPSFLGFKKRREQRQHEQLFRDSSYQERTRERASMTDTAAHLALAACSRVIAVGHDHVCGLVPRMVPNPRTGTYERVIVANSGDFVASGRAKTAVFVDTDERTVRLLMHDKEGVKPLKGPVDF